MHTSETIKVVPARYPLRVVGALVALLVLAVVIQKQGLSQPFEDHRVKEPAGEDAPLPARVEGHRLEHTSETIKVVPARYPLRVVGALVALLVLAVVIQSGQKQGLSQPFEDHRVKEPAGEDAPLPARVEGHRPRLSSSWLLSSLAWSYIWLFRSLPLIVVLIILYNFSYLHAQHRAEQGQKQGLSQPFEDHRVKEPAGEDAPLPASETIKVVPARYPLRVVGALVALLVLAVVIQSVAVPSRVRSRVCPSPSRITGSKNQRAKTPHSQRGLKAACWRWPACPHPGCSAASPGAISGCFARCR
jgi:hypothetical protein